MSFEEMVQRCLQSELDAIVKGESLYSRIYRTCDMAARWRASQEEKKESKE